MSIWTGKFWKATTERAIATAAQGALATVGTDLFGLLDVDAVAVLSIAGGAALVSVLKSVAVTAATGSPSAGGGETLEPRVDTHRADWRHDSAPHGLRIVTGASLGPLVSDNYA